MNGPTNCNFLYFKSSGKWAYDGRGIFETETDGSVTHQTIFNTNNGMPGILSKGEEYTIVVLPDDSCEHKFAYPRMITPTKS